MNRLVFFWPIFLTLLLIATPSLAQITVRSTSQAGVTTGNLVIPKPAGTNINDVLVAVITTVPSDRRLRQPSGWTEVANDGSSGAPRLNVFTRIVDASDASVTSYTFRVDGSSHSGAAGALIAFIGVNTGTPLDVTPVLDRTPSGFTHAARSITTTARGAMLVNAFAMPGATDDWLPPAGMVEAADVTSTTVRPTTSGVSLTVVFQALGAPGATGARTATADDAGLSAAAGRTVSLALRPALAPASTHYRLDGDAGSMAGTAGEVFDSGGTALHGFRRTVGGTTTTNFVSPNPTIHGQVNTVTGQFCNAAQFDGRSVLEVPASPLFDYTTEFSASAWIFPTELPGGGGLSSVLSNDQNYEFHLNSAGRLNWWWGGGARELTSNAVIPLNRWTHVAITFRSVAGSARQRIYINGQLDSATNAWVGTLTPNGCSFYIGGDVATGAGCSLIGDRAFRGTIDEVKLYNYELTDVEVNNDRRIGRNCSNAVSRYRIEHDGSAHSCAAETITVRACASSDCSSLSSAGATGTIVAGGNSTPFSIPVGQNSTSVSLLLPTTTGPPDPENVRLGIGSVSPVAGLVPSCRNGAGDINTAAACDVSVIDAGFVLTVPDHVADTPQTVTIQALRRNQSGPGTTACAPLFSGGEPRNVGFWATYADPTTGTRPVSFAGSTLGAASPGTPVTLTFDASGTATASLRYADAGAVQLNARYAGGAAGDSGLLITGADRFVTKPARFELTIPGNNVAPPADVTRPVFAVAGETFPVSVRALNASGAVTPNFGRESTAESVRFDSVLLAPAGGHNPTPVAAGFSSWTNGEAMGTVRFDEVGVITLRPRLASRPYIDFSPSADGDVVGSDVERVGRFRPARLSVMPNTPTLENACVAGGFGYVGQAFRFATEPAFTIAGINANGAVTLNYDVVVGGNSNPFRRFSGALVGRAYGNAASGTAATLSRTTDGGAGVVSDSLPASFDGFGRVTVTGDRLTYAKSLVPEAPFNALVSMSLTAADLTDSDGVCFDTAARDGCDPLTIAAIGGASGAPAVQRWGRIAVTNAFGPELIDLQVPMRAEFFNGTTFVLNADDVCSGVTMQPIVDANAGDTLLPSETCVQDSGSPGASGQGCSVPGPPLRRYTSVPTVGNGGRYTLWLRAPGAGNVGVLDVRPSIPAWLQFNWTGAGPAAPTARVGFGVFQGDRRAIHEREVY